MSNLCFDERNNNNYYSLNKNTFELNSNNCNNFSSEIKKII